MEKPQGAEWRPAASAKRAEPSHLIWTTVLTTWKAIGAYNILWHNTKEGVSKVEFNRSNKEVNQPTADGVNGQMY